MKPRLQERMRRRLPPTALLLAVALSGAAAPLPAQERPRRHAVTIEAVQFSPATVEARVGDTVVWTNRDPFPHNVTAERAGWHSGDLGSGKSWRFTPHVNGVFPYVCTLHPGMKGVLVVK